MEPEHFESLYPEGARFEEIEKILNFVKEGNSCQIVSAPGVGRSNVLGFLAYNKKIRQKHLGDAQENFHFIYLNFSEIRKKPLSDATKFMFLSLVDSLRERKMNEEYETTNKIFRESLGFKDEMVVFSGLKKAIDYLALEKNLTVVFLFDRFEEYISVVDDDFFSNLRVLRNRAKYKFSVVFSLNRPLEEILEATLFSDFYEFVAGKVIYLSLLDKVGVDFRISYLEKIVGKKLNKKLFEEILDVTGGHSNLVRLSAETLLTSAQKYKNKLLLKKFLLEQKPIRSSLFGIWNNLSPSEQSLFLESGKLEDKYLESVGLIRNGFCSIPIFSDYVKERVSVERQNEELKINDAGEILKGETVFSDRLTSLEFKLLKFLIEGKDRVLEKEEIINAVWKEAKTTMGVTDQALDQLVFRLRKKIEEDPNDPKHILTVKGRGFKYS